MTEAPQQAPPVRHRRLLLWSLLGLLLVGILGMGGGYLGRRGLATGVVDRQLRKMGAGDVEFRIAALGSGGFRIDDLRLPGDAVRATRVEASYSLGGLLGLRLKSASVQGLDVEVRRDASGWKLPVLDWVSGLTLPAADPAAPASFQVSLPEATVDGTVRVAHHELGEWRIPVTASASVTPSEAEFSTSAFLMGDRQTLSGTLDADLSGEVQLDGALADLSMVHAFSRYADVSLPVEILPGGGALALHADVSLEKGRPVGATSELSLSGTRLRWRDYELGVGTVNLAARTTTATMADWDATGQVEGLGGLGATIPELVFEATGSPAAGKLQITSCQFRYGAIRGTLVGELAWAESHDVTGVLRLVRLDMGDLALENAVLSVQGNPSALDWRLDWHAEEAVWGMHSLELAGTASLVGSPASTVTGKMVCSLGSLLKRSGLPGWAGEMTLAVSPESRFAVDADGVAWQGGATASCPSLSGSVAGWDCVLDGVSVALTGDGKGGLGDVMVKVGSSNGRAMHGDLRIPFANPSLTVRGEQLGLDDIVALAMSPLDPLPAEHVGKLTVSASLGAAEASLASIAQILGLEREVSGTVGLEGVDGEGVWSAAGLAWKLVAGCHAPDLNVVPLSDVDLSLPTKLSVSLAGTSRSFGGTVEAEGGQARMQVGKATAALKGWQASLAVSGVQTRRLSRLPERVRRSRRLPPGAKASATLMLDELAADVGAWTPLLTPLPVGGSARFPKMEARLDLDDTGLGGKISLVGGVRKLRIGAADTGILGGDLHLSLAAQGSPQSVAGSGGVALVTPDWHRGKMRGSAGRAQLGWSFVDMNLPLLRQFLADPFATGQSAGQARMDLSLSLVDGTIPGTMSGVSLRVPSLGWTPEAGWQTGQDGMQLAIGELGERGVKLKDSTVDVSVSGRDVKLAAALPLVGPGVTATAEGSGRLIEEPSWQVSLAVPEFGVSTDQGWVLGLADFGGMEFSGKVSATATARSRGGDLSAKVGLALREGNAKLAEDTGDIQGVEASLSLNLLPIVASDPHQTLRFASARVGKVALGRGLVSFRLDSADELFVEEAHVGWYGGELDTYALRFDAKRSDLSAVVYARDVDAGKLLEVFPGVKGTGDGRLHGRLPVFRKAGRYGYGTGYLYSVPGEKGHLEVTELGPLLPAMGRMGAQGEMIAGALRNFDYDLFRVDIRPEGSKDQGIRMRLEGNEKGAENTPPLRLDVNVLGAIEEALNVGMELGSAGKTLENFSKLQSFLRKSIE